jgi:hypothetical protein
VLEERRSNGTKELALSGERLNNKLVKIDSRGGKRAEAEKVGEKTASEEESGDCHAAIDCRDGV